MTKVQIIKNRSDIGAGTRGADMGIDAIEIAAINAGNEYFNIHDYVDVPTHNESIYDKVKTTFAKRIGHVVTQCKRVCEAVKTSILENHFPIVLSGDHSSALGTISGIKAAFPDKKLGIVWIDAHADIQTPYTSMSGNVHGMPLAAALDIDNMDNAINVPEQSTIDDWNSLKTLGGISPKSEPNHLIYFGLRDVEDPENNVLEDFNIRNFSVSEVRHRGVNICCDEALDKLKNCDLLYVSFDVDSMDCDMISDGTGTPVPKGFDQYEVMNIILRFIQSKKMVGFEIVEINPLLDHKGNRMAEIAFEVLDHVTQQIKLNYIN